MRVHLIKRQTIEDYVRLNAAGRPAFQRWLSVVKYADWNAPEDIMKTYGSADILGMSTNRVVFNIGGNNYRIICKYAFGHSKIHLFVCWIGTHAEYTRLCERNHQYTVNQF